MNKIILIGRLTKDPELKYTNATNVARCTFGLAVNRSFTRQGEERKADFFNIVTWNKTAEFCSKYFVKGQQVALAGRMESRTYDDPQGIKRLVWDVIAEEAHFADSKRGEGQSYPDVPGGKASVIQAPPDSGGDDDSFFNLSDDSDDIPF